MQIVTFFSSAKPTIFLSAMTQFSMPMSSGMPARFPEKVMTFGKPTSAERSIEAELARIFREVFPRSKLCRIDKNADDHGVAGETGSAYQGAMTRMQCAHCRHEPDRDPLPVKAAAPCGHRREAADAVHERGSAVEGEPQVGREP